MKLMEELAYSKQAGMAVLAYLISSADGIEVVCALLQKEDFHSKQHRKLFETLQEMFENGLPLDIYLTRRACFSASNTRYYIFFNNTLLVGNCEERIGRKVLIDLKAFEASTRRSTEGETRGSSTK